MTIPKYEPYDFANRRHIGPSPVEIDAMLAVCGVGDLDELIDQTVPEGIRLAEPLDFGPPLSERGALDRLRATADKGGTEFEKGDTAATLESVKAASDIYAPLAGEIIEVNQAIVEDPSIVNSDPMGEGWFFKLKLADPSVAEALMDEDAYKTMVG